jgi:hypothetical protein
MLLRQHRRGSRQVDAKRERGEPSEGDKCQRDDHRPHCRGCEPMAGVLFGELAGVFVFGADFALGTPLYKGERVITRSKAV